MTDNAIVWNRFSSTNHTENTCKPHQCFVVLYTLYVFVHMFTKGIRCTYFSMSNSRNKVSAGV